MLLFRCRRLSGERSGASFCILVKCRMTLGCVPTVNDAGIQTSIQLLAVIQEGIKCRYIGVRKFLGRKKCEGKQRKRIIIDIPVAVLKEK